MQRIEYHRTVNRRRIKKWIIFNKKWRERRIDILLRWDVGDKIWWLVDGHDNGSSSLKKIDRKWGR